MFTSWDAEPSFFLPSSGERRSKKEPLRAALPGGVACCCCSAALGVPSTAACAPFSMLNPLLPTTVLLIALIALGAHVVL